MNARVRLPPWELQPYEQAAREACIRLHQNPDELLEVDGGMWVPHWLEMAARLREMHVLQTTLAECGPHGPA